MANRKVSTVVMLSKVAEVVALILPASAEMRIGRVSHSFTEAGYLPIASRASASPLSIFLMKHAS